jgi:N-methylhydantoinase A
MGGTTAKLSIVDDGKPAVAYSFEAAREKRFIEGSGLPVRISTLELIEIGAGGGSIAHLDEIGLLKVGPESAGSEPGPAAYGRGGTQPTVTDADFLLGFLDPGYFAGGTMTIDMKAARAAMGRLPGEVSAWGIYDLVNENMANAARVHLAEHGRDPRRYTLLATGGAGPVHAYYVARKLGLARLIVPPGAGVASALGLLVAPARVDRVATVARTVADIVWPDLEAVFARLESEAAAVLAQTLPGRSGAAVQRLADIRYVGQASDLVVPLPAGPYTAGSRSALLEAFEASYVAAFTRTPPTSNVEIINVRVSSSIAVESGAAASARAEPARNAVKGKRPVFFQELAAPHPTTVYDRYALTPGQAFAGPAIVEERESTLVVGPGGRFEVAPSGNIIATIG